MKQITKILIEKTYGSTTILILKKPLLLSHFLAFKHTLKQNATFTKNYKTLKPLWKE